MENPVPQQPVTYQTPLPETKASSPYLLYVVIVLLLILLPAIGVGAYYMGSKSLATNVQSLPLSTQPTVQPVGTNPSPVVTTLLANYLKRQFSVSDKFFSDKEYPEELKVDESALIGMNCSERISCDSPYTDCTYLPKGAPPTEESIVHITDQKTLDIIKQSNLARDELTPDGNGVRNVMEVTICDTEDNRKIIEYKTGGGGGGAGSMDFIGVVNPDGTVKKVSSISENTAYFGCYKPLQLTTSNILYYQCGGGDGPFGASTLYKIDLNAGTTQALLSCSSLQEEVNGEFTGQSIITCK